MKRNIIVDKLIKKGLSESTLVKMTDNQLGQLAERMLGEQVEKPSVKVNPNLPNAAQIATNIAKSGTSASIGEELKGNQKKIDKNHNGKIDSQDFKILKGQKSKKCHHCGKEMTSCSCDDSHMDEELKGNQKKIDKNHNSKIDSEDFAILNKEKKGKTKEEVNEADMGLTVKGSKSSSTSTFGGTPKKSSTPKKKTTPKKKEEDETEEGEVDESLNGLMLGVIKDKLSKDLGREPKNHEIDKAHEDFVNSWKKDNESKEKKKKGYVVPKPPVPNYNGHKKKEEKEKDVEEGNKFSGELAKAKSQHKDSFDVDGKKYDVKESKKCPDCDEDMKDCKCDDSHLDENRKVKNWVNNLAENKLYHSFTSKNEIMNLIKTKLNESETMTPQFGSKVKQGHNGIPEFMSYEAITSSGPATAPTKPTTKPGTKPGTKPKTPYQPGPGPNHKPKALSLEEKKSGPATAPTKPTTKPGTKPGTKPKKDNPYTPKPGPNHKPKALAEKKVK